MDYLKMYIAALASEKTNQTTITCYLSDLKHFQAWLEIIYGEPSLNPTNITGLDIASYRSHLLITVEKKPAEINRALSSLGKFLDWSKDQGYIADNPVVDIPKVKPLTISAKILIDKDYNQLMRAVYQSNDTRDIALIELLVGAGLRIGEVAALSIHDVITTDRMGLITIRNDESGKLKQVPLKGSIRKAINSYLVERPVCSSETLFISQKGRPFSTQDIGSVLKKYGLSVGEVTPHRLRNTHKTQLFRKPNIASLQ
jgi:integrase/recombinase XerD